MLRQRGIFFFSGFLQPIGLHAPVENTSKAIAGSHLPSPSIRRIKDSFKPCAETDLSYGSVRAWGDRPERQRCAKVDFPWSTLQDCHPVCAASVLTVSVRLINHSPVGFALSHFTARSLQISRRLKRRSGCMSKARPRRSRGLWSGDAPDHSGITFLPGLAN